MKYVVYVDDNSHYSDESERRTLGDFASAQAAIAAARKVVDAYLEAAHKPRMTADELYRSYTAFGEDPFLVTDDPNCTFSAWDYAKERCRELCAR